MLQNLTLKKTSNNRRKTGRNPEQDREGSKREGKNDFHKAPVVVVRRIILPLALRL